MKLIGLMPVRLQWGRDQLIAEFSQSHSRQAGGERLQWGRDQLIAELSWLESR